MSTLKITKNKIKPAVVASIQEGSIGCLLYTSDAADE